VVPKAEAAKLEERKKQASQDKYVGIHGAKFLIFKILRIDL